MPPLLVQRAVRLGHLLVRVGQQREVELLLVGELLLVSTVSVLMPMSTVSSLANSSTLSRKPHDSIVQPLRHRLGVEEQDDVLALQVLQAERLGVLLVRQHLVDGRGRQLDAGAGSPSFGAAARANAEARNSPARVKRIAVMGGFSLC